MSASARRRSHEPTITSALAWNSRVGRLRTRFTVADGLPEPRRMPADPRRISTRSSTAVSGWMKFEPAWYMFMPSTCSESMAKPRE
ncbi:Uncharacterised protein [Achromobacter sp. 2789STDY5608615]|uniref:hypothetical protein n=1 Tax=Achromobacter sp. 2789STDY5608615 TaxID=1806492 RepID=UPI0006BF7B96|nr:hypothetical protein [Achromobacter sp. 2789STDY5608615]CUJ89313.1 Uncharacterised protein [Achromobacter sp. 2789STDY5608615]